MDESLVYMIGAGVLALILIILILRFAVRPKKAAAPQATGLGLPVSPPGNAAARDPKPLAPYAAAPAEEGARFGPARGVGSTAGPGVLGRDTEPDAAPASRAVSAASSSGGRETFHQNGCPKCGGRFFEGELEGPTLMVDGVAREEFQPLLTAKECSACGYLELYTRPART